jgi:uncharacterized protein YjdB
MEGKLKRIISFFLVFCFILMPITSVSGAESDISGHWAEKTMKEWNDQGWFNGNGSGIFRPDAGITRAEFMALVNKMMGYAHQGGKVSQYVDVSSDKWYYGDVSAALEAGYIKGTDKDKVAPEEMITRQEAITIVDNIKGINPSEDLSVLSAANDGSKTADWAKGYVAAAIKEGLVGGSSGNINPLGNITRAETIVLLDRVYTDTRVFAFEGKYGPEHDTVTVGSIIISSPDVVINNMHIKGTATVEKSVGEGNVSFNNVIVDGNVNVYGGGINSILFNNVDVNGALVINKNNGNVRILATGSTKVSVTILESGAMLVTKELTGGGFETVEIAEYVIKDQNIIFDGSFKSIVNFAKDAAIEINGTVKEFVANESANITGKAEIEKVAGSENAAVKINGKDVTGQPVTPGGSGGGGNGGSNVDVTGVAIVEKDFELKIGEKKQLTASVTPSNATNKNVKWSSDNSDVAEVSPSGEVTAKSAGKAVMTVATVSGSKTASVTVTVKPVLSEMTVEASTITTSSALTSVQVENSRNLSIDNVLFDDGSYKISLNANAALTKEDGGNKAYFIISLKGGDIPLDTEGVTAVIAENITGTAMKASVKYDVKFEEGLADDIKAGSFIFEIDAGSNERLRQYYLTISKEGYSDLELEIVYIPEYMPEITGIGRITGENTIGSVLTAGNVEYSKTVSPGYEQGYRWYRSDEIKGEYTRIEGATGKTYTITEADSGKYIKAAAVGDGIGAYDVKRSEAFGPVEKVVTADEVFEELEKVYLGENNSAGNITKDMNLVKSLAGFPGVAIAWSSDEAAVNAVDGKITRDKEDDIIVKLTAVLSGTVKGTKKYEVIVRMESLENVGIVGYIDEKFADGYPQAYVKDGTVWVKFAVKEDAEVYMVVNGMNGQHESDAEAVFNGHVGKAGRIIHSSNWPYFEAKKDMLVEFDTKVNIGRSNKEFRVEFAVKTTDGYKSSNSTTILFSSEVVKALDTVPPRTEGIFINGAFDKIYVYFDERIDLTVKPNATDFVLSKGEIKAVSDMKNLDEDSNKGSRIILDVENIDSSNLEGLTLSYNGSDIRDVSDAKNALVPANDSSANWENSIKDEKVHSPMPKITSAMLSHDRKNMVIDVEPCFNVDKYDMGDSIRFSIKSGDTTYTVTDKDVDYSYSCDGSDITFRLSFEKPLPVGSVTVEMHAKDLETYADEEIANNLLYNNVELLHAVGQPKAYFENKRIRVEYNKDLKLYNMGNSSHFFTIKVESEEYRLRGFLVRTSYDNPNCFDVSLDDKYSQRFLDAVEQGFTQEKPVQIKYERLADGTYGEEDQLMDAAGGLLPAFGYINITKQP